MFYVLQYMMKGKLVGGKVVGVGSLTKRLQAYTWMAHHNSPSSHL